MLKKMNLKGKVRLFVFGSVFEGFRFLLDVKLVEITCVLTYCRLFLENVRAKLSNPLVRIPSPFELHAE
jgi:hypothetical protein